MLFNPNVLLEQVADIPEEAGLQLTEIASRMGKPRSTLGRELNPDDGGAKLGIVDFVFLVAETRSFAALDYIESSLGRCAFTLPPAGAGHGALHQKLGAAGKEFGEVMKQLCEDLADGRLDEPEAALKEIADLAQVLAELRAQVLTLAQKRRG
jgi:hypothetical protein